MHRVIIKTAKKREVLDITDLVEDQLADSAGSSLSLGQLVNGTRYSMAMMARPCSSSML
jgi:hypothetical protein